MPPSVIARSARSVARTTGMLSRARSEAATRPHPAHARNAVAFPSDKDAHSEEGSAPIAFAISAELLSLAARRQLQIGNPVAAKRRSAEATYPGGIFAGSANRPRKTAWTPIASPTGSAEKLKIVARRRAGPASQTLRSESHHA